MNHYWHLFPASIKQKVLNQHFKGMFSKSYAEQVDLDYQSVSEGSEDEGLSVTLTLLIDPEMSMVVDCRYQCFGPTLAVIACELVCEYWVSKTIVRASHITAKELLSSYKPDLQTVLLPYVEHIIALKESLLGSYSPKTPVEKRTTERDETFETLPFEEKKQRINEVIDDEIRPFLQMDNGDLKILDLTSQMTLLIQYEGACVSCPTSLSGTLSSIQGILQDRLDPSIIVEPVLKK